MTWFDDQHALAFEAIAVAAINAGCKMRGAAGVGAWIELCLAADTG